MTSRYARRTTARRTVLGAALAVSSLGSVLSLSLGAQEPPRRPAKPVLPTTPRAGSPRPAESPRPAIAPRAWGDFDLTLDGPLGGTFDARFDTKFDTKFDTRFDLAWQDGLERSFDFAIDKAEMLARTTLPRLEALAPTMALGELEGRDFAFTSPGDGERPRSAWLQGDPADSLYRQGRELLNSGEYRRAAAAFRDIATRMPSSGYAADAHYWWAFSLYRIGGTAELQQATEVLATQKTKYPAARMLAQSDALSLRIRGALAARGDAAAAASIRTAAGDSALRCDREEQGVRVEALNALTQSDAEGAMPVLQKTLARRDTCSVMLRRTAVFLVGSKKRDASGVTILSQVARTDPAVEVRASALEWLARAPGDEALATLEELARDTSDERVQRAAVRALVSHQSPRARQLVRGLVERNETPEKLRIEALGAFDRDRASAEDVAWMRTLYGRTDNPRIKSRIVNTLASIGGPDVDQWMLTIARNTDENSDTRRYAVRRVGNTLPIADLAKLYDSSAERAIREALIETMAKRPEGEATDKLLEIVKSGTDPQLRSRAISALTSKKDPRTLRLLMEIIDK